MFAAAKPFTPHDPSSFRCRLGLHGATVLILVVDEGALKNVPPVERGWYEHRCNRCGKLVKNH